VLGSWAAAMIKASFWSQSIQPFSQKKSNVQSVILNQIIYMNIIYIDIYLYIYPKGRLVFSLCRQIAFLLSPNNSDRLQSTLQHSIFIY
jgi:hypothetical protein